MVGLAPVVSPTTDSCCGQQADTLTQSGHLWFLAPLALASCALSGTSRHPASALPWIGLGPDVHVRETPPFVSTLAQRGAFIITGRVRVRVVLEAAHGVGRRVMPIVLRTKRLVAKRLVRM